MFAENRANGHFCTAGARQRGCPSDLLEVGHPRITKPDDEVYGPEPLSLALADPQLAIVLFMQLPLEDISCRSRRD